MKKLLKVLGIASIFAAVLGFGFVACDNGSGGGSGNTDPTPPGPGGEVTVNAEWDWTSTTVTDINGITTTEATKSNLTLTPTNTGASGATLKLDSDGIKIASNSSDGAVNGKGLAAKKNSNNSGTSAKTKFTLTLSGAAKVTIICDGAGSADNVRTVVLAKGTTAVSANASKSNLASGTEVTIEEELEAGTYTIYVNGSRIQKIIAKTPSNKAVVTFEGDDLEKLTATPSSSNAEIFTVSYDSSTHKATLSGISAGDAFLKCGDKNIAKVTVAEETLVPTVVGLPKAMVLDYSGVEKVFGADAEFSAEGLKATISYWLREETKEVTEVSETDVEGKLVVTPPSDFETAGADKDVSVSYTEDGVNFTAQYKISKSNASVNGIEIEDTEVKKEYKAGYALDLSALVVKEKWSDNSDSTETSDYTVKVTDTSNAEVNKDALTAGTLTVTITSGKGSTGDFVKTFTITVKAVYKFSWKPEDIATTDNIAKYDGTNKLLKETLKIEKTSDESTLSLYLTNNEASSYNNFASGSVQPSGSDCVFVEVKGPFVAKFKATGNSSTAKTDRYARIMIGDTEYCNEDEKAANSGKGSMPANNSSTTVTANYEGTDKVRVYFGSSNNYYQLLEFSIETTEAQSASALSTTPVQILADKTAEDLAIDAITTVTSGTPAVATVALSGTDIMVTPVKVGSSIISVAGTDGNAAKVLIVVTESGAVDVRKVTPNPFKAGEYPFTPEDMAKVHLVGESTAWTVAIKVGSENVISYDGSANKVTSKKAGTAHLTITDASNNVAEIKLVVKEDGDFDTNEMTVTNPFIEKTETVTLTDEQKTALTDATITVTPDGAATCELTEGVISITSKAAGAEKDVTVKVQKDQTSFIQPLTIDAEGNITLGTSEYASFSAATLEITAAKATAPAKGLNLASITTATSDAEGVATVEKEDDGSKITISSVSSGTAKVTVTGKAKAEDTEEQTIEIAVTVAANGAISVEYVEYTDAIKWYVMSSYAGSVDKTTEATFTNGSVTLTKKTYLFLDATYATGKKVKLTFDIPYASYSGDTSNGKFFGGLVATGKASDKYYAVYVSAKGISNGSKEYSNGGSSNGHGGTAPKSGTVTYSLEYTIGSNDSSIKLTGSVSDGTNTNSKTLKGSETKWASSNASSTVPGGSVIPYIGNIDGSNSVTISNIKLYVDDVLVSTTAD